MAFTGDLLLEFGDWGKNVGRIAILRRDLLWENQKTGFSITIPSGTMTDGASVPRLLWWFLPPWGDKSTRAAVLHDYICGLVEEGLGALMPQCDTRAKCDREFRHALLALGVNLVSAWIAWAGVRLYSIWSCKR